MATLSEIRDGLAANLGAISGFQVSPYALGNPTPPSAEIVPARVEYDHAGSRGLDVYFMTVRVFVGLASDVGAQKQLDEFLDKDGASSVKEAIEADPTLGGVVDDLIVKRSSGYRVYEAGGRPVLGAEWDVELYG